MSNKEISLFEFDFFYRIQIIALTMVIELVLEKYYLYHFSIPPANHILQEILQGSFFAGMKNSNKGWHVHIEEQAKSSFTIQAYCKRHRLSTGMFYYWRRKLTVKAPEGSLQEIEVLSPIQTAPVIEVHLGPGKFIRIEGQISAVFLRELLQC